MDGLFKRVDAGHHVAYLVTMHGPHGPHRGLTALFAEEDDAELYASAVKAWWNALFPATCVEGVVWHDVERRLAVFDGRLVHTLGGRGTSFEMARVAAQLRAFADWKAAEARDGGLGAFERGAALARRMGLPHSREARVRCCPRARGCCLLELACCLLCVPHSVPRCCWCGPGLE